MIVMRLFMYLYLWRVDGDCDEYSNIVGKDEVVESIYERLRFPVASSYSWR